MSIEATRIILDNDPILYTDEIYDPIDYEDDHNYALWGWIFFSLGFIAILALTFIPINL